MISIRCLEAFTPNNAILVLRGKNGRIEPQGHSSSDLGNPAAAHYFIPIVKHRGLTRRYRALRLRKLDKGVILCARLDASGSAGMIVANLHLRIDGIAGSQRPNPVYIPNEKAAAEELPVVSHHDAILCRVQ